MNIIVNGKAVELEEGSRALEAAKAHSPELYKAALVAHINGQRMSLPTVLKEGDVVEILGWEHEDARWTLRHTGSHVLAQAVKRLYPETKLAIGPAIDNGFYYDFDSEISFTPEILEKIEAEMKKALQRRIEIICGIASLKLGEEVFRDINIEFKRNVPEDITSTINVINSLKGTVSDATLLGQLPFVDDVNAEIEAVSNQKKANMELYSFGNAESADEDEETEEV